MKKSYLEFINQLSLVNFDRVAQRMASKGIESPKPETYQLQTSSKNEKYRKSPSFNKKQPFDNRQNIYLRMVDLMKGFCLSEETSFISYIEYEEGFGHLLNKVQNLRVKNGQFQILMFLILSDNKKLIRTYIRLRKQILTRCSLNKIKYNPVALHNQTKYFNKEAYELASINIDYEYWGFMVDTAKAEISEQMLWWLSDGSRQLGAVEFVKACLWQQVAGNKENPQLS